MANEIRMRQGGVGGLVEDNPLTAAATLLTSAGLAAVSGGVDSSHHLPLILDPDGNNGPPEIAYVASLTAGAGATGTTGLLRGQEGTTARQHDQDTPWLHGPTPRDYVSWSSKKITSGDISFAQSTAWAKGPSAFEVNLPAFVGDYIELSVNCMADSSATQNLWLDLLTLNGAGGTAVTYFASGGTTANEGIEGLTADQAYKRFGANAILGPLGSSDVVSGRVYATLGYRTNNSGAARVLFANANNPLLYYVKNIGPPVS
jgi:hypothetical protein